MYEFIEEKLGRTLSPFEYETIESWKEKYTEEEIKKAVEIAYTNNARNINYIRSVLLSKKEDIKPSWLDKEIKNEPMAKEELEEWNELLKDFK